MSVFQLVVYRYQKEDISLAKAAELAGVSWVQLRDILLEKGVQPRLGPQSLAEAQEEVALLLDLPKSRGAI